MKKLWYTLVSILILVFVIITLSKKNEQVDASHSTVSTDPEKRETLQQFWSLYREATSFRIAGKWQSAVDKYLKALEINPEHKDAIYYLGNMYLETGNAELARKEWQKLIRLNPNSARAHYQMGNLYMNSTFKEFYDLDKAEAEFETTLAINKDFIQPLLQLGRISLYRRDHSKALEHFSTVLGSDPKNVESNFLAGFIFWKRGERLKAIEYYEAAYANAAPQALPEGASNEGDTKEGKSLERHINQSMFHSYFIDLSSLPEDNLSEEMESRYMAIDSVLSK